MSAPFLGCSTTHIFKIDAINNNNYSHYSYSIKSNNLPNFYLISTQIKAALSSHGLFEDPNSNIEIIINYGVDGPTRKVVYDGNGQPKIKLVFNKYLIISAYDKNFSPAQEQWTVRVKNENEKDSIDSLLLVAAAMDYINSNTYKEIEIKIKEKGDSRILFLRGDK